MGGFTNSVAGFVKKKPKTTLATTIALAVGVVFTISNSGGGDNFTMNKAGNASFTGAILSTTGGTIGWSIQSANNQACETTCANGCVFGWDTSAAGGDADIADCADVANDECLCSGPS